MSDFLKQSLVLGLICLGLAFIGLSITYHNNLRPQDFPTEFKQIHADGWVEDGSRIELPDLLGRGNRLDLLFNAWRPDNTGAAHLRVKLCGEPAADFKVTRQNPIHSIFLKAACEPKVISFEVVNPFSASKTDRRRLGAQIISADITSKLGLPILRPGLVFQKFLALFILSGLVLLMARFARSDSRRRLVEGLALVMPFICLFFMHNAGFRDRALLFPLYLFSLFLALGVLTALWLKVRTRIPIGIENPRGAWMPRVLILCIVAIAAGMRFYGLQFGLPANFHPDEVPKINAISRMVDYGDLNPRYFLHPSLLLYSAFFMSKLFAWLGVPEAFGIVNDWRTATLLAGRTASALAGTFSVYLVFLIGRRLFAPAVGIISALILAVSPLHITCSRVLKEDALLVFVILLTIAVLLKAIQEDKKYLVLLAGLLAGLSASVKYSGLLTGLIVASAPWLKSRSWKPDLDWLPITFAGCALAPVGFLIGTPYSVLDSATFLKDFNSERRHMLRGHTTPIDAWSQYWMYHFSRSLLPALSKPTTLIAVAGLGLLAWRRRIEDLLIVGLILLYYLPAEWVKAKPAPQPERYIFPCLPFLALAAGEFIRQLWFSRARLVVPILALVAVVVPANRSMSLAAEVKNDTRQIMSDWMVKNLPHGTKLYLDWKPYNPRFWNNEFEITYIPRATILQMLYLDSLRNSGQDYMVFSSLFYDRYFSQPNTDPAIRRIITTVFERVPIIMELRPTQGTYGFHNPVLTLFSFKPEEFAKLDDEVQRKRRGEIAATSNEAKTSFFERYQASIVR